MQVYGIDYGRAWCAAGARNFFGQGWPHHRLPWPIRPDFAGSTLVAKTTTLELRKGNLPLRGDGMPTEALPRCIVVNGRKAAVLNAVGLSGPGLDALLADGRWQRMTRPFVLSFMATGSTPKDRHWEAIYFTEKLRNEIRRNYFGPFAIELNVSCPNIGLDPAPLIKDARTQIQYIASRLPDVPLIPKFNLLVPPAAVAEIYHADGLCTAVCCSNSVPYGALPDRIDWRGLFGEPSPLAHLGGGGLSGAPLTPLVLEWAAELKRIAPEVPLVACGGVMRPRDARALLRLGVAAVEIGSVAITRPWRVQRIIREINSWKR